MESELFRFDPELKEIDRIDFDIFGNREILEYSALDKTTNGLIVPDLYENQEAKVGGLVDARMGTTNNQMDCTTCELNTIYCIGHFGHIKLAEPVFNIEYLSTLKKILGCICLQCSKILTELNESDIKKIIKKSGKHRLSEIRGYSKYVSHCSEKRGGCGAPVSKIRLDTKTLTLMSEYTIVDDEAKGTEQEGKSVKIKQNLTPSLCYDILNSISDYDCMLLGFNPTKSRPEMMIHTYFPVPPIAIRPSVRADFISSGMMEDDLTHKLADIVKHNNKIMKQKETANENADRYTQDHLNLLQYHIASYYDNETLAIPKSEQKNGKIYKSLSSRIKGKEGRLRSNLEGKRGDFSGRTVITPDPLLDVDQLGVPLLIAMNITKPIMITHANREELQKMVNNKREIYPGANFVHISSERTMTHLDLRFCKEKLNLKVGDIVERHLINDDYVLFNRQPTLHRQSMMAHRVQIIVDKSLATFRMNPAIVTPYNADFDGDEMNIFVPQSEQATLELEEIAKVQKQLIVATLSMPIFGLIQDCLIGIYNLTLLNTIDWKTAMNMIAFLNYNPELVSHLNVKKNKTMTGKELFSQILPKRINLIIGDSVQIENGVLKKGVITGDFLKSKKGTNLSRFILDEYNEQEANLFITNIQKLAHNVNMFIGGTVKIGDTYLPEDIYTKKKKLLHTKESTVNILLTDIENNPNLLHKDLVEKMIMNETEIILTEMSDIVIAKMNEDNNFLIMLRSGARGEKVNVGQINGCLGQQSLEKKRMPKKINFRSLPYFFQHDDTMYSRGLIRHSLLEGLNWEEYVFHLITSRSAMIDVALKTAESGYLQRKLVKSMEDIMIRYDQTVRTINDILIQYIYGDNGLDTTKQWTGNLFLLEYGNKKIHEVYAFTDDELKQLKSKFKQDDYIKRLITYRDNLRNKYDLWNIKTTVLDTRVFLPFNIQRLVNKYRNTQKNIDMTPDFIIGVLDKIVSYENMPFFCIPYHLVNENSIKLKDDYVCKQLITAYIHSMLAPRRVLFEYKISKEKLLDLCNELPILFRKTVVEPGEMVGVISAQSLGEPVTQMTLKQFHFSGIAAMGTTNLGVPRIRELLSFSKNIKTPKMIIYLLDEYMENKNVVKSISSYITYTNLQQIRKSINVYYDPEPLNSFYKNDRMNKPFYIFGVNGKKSSVEFSSIPWLIRIELEPEKLLHHEITLLDINTQICKTWEKYFDDLKSIKKEEKDIVTKMLNLAVLSNQENDITPVIHIRFMMNPITIKYIIDFVELVIENIKIKGIDTITAANYGEEMTLKYDKSNGEIIKKRPYVIYTNGINMEKLFYVNGINLNTSHCNNIETVYKYFGTEAARAIILREFSLAYERGGNNVIYHHLSILADTMTSSGTITSIDRHGMAKVETEVLAAASFEKPFERLINACTFGEQDRMNSVSSRIMAGLVIKGGTGLCELQLDTNMLERSEWIPEKGTAPFTSSNIIETITQDSNTHAFFTPD